MKKVILKRTYLKDRSLGRFVVKNGKGEILSTYYTLELPWLDNKHNISCIPEGTYTVVPNHTDKHPNTYRILGVPDRSGILIHIANYPEDIKGCIAIGLCFKDLDQDGMLDVADSTKATKSLWELIGEKTFKLTIEAA